MNPEMLANLRKSLGGNSILKDIAKDLELKKLRTIVSTNKHPYAKTLLGTALMGFVIKKIFDSAEMKGTPRDDLTYLQEGLYYGW